MAITIDSAPVSQYHLAYRPILWTVSSNDATVVRCIADIQLDSGYYISVEKSPFAPTV